MNTDAPKQIGTDRQLFVDDYWIDESNGTRRVLHEPVRENVAIASERPWESIFSGYHVVLHTGSLWRMYYLTSGQVGEQKGGWRYCAIAESQDGIEWTKPDLDHIEFAGSTKNNLVYGGPHTEFAPFLDSNPDAAEDERYKAFARTQPVEGVERGLVPLGSPDGIQWHQMSDGPIITDGPFDSHNLPFWDELRGEYVVYARGVGNPDNSAAASEQERGREFKGGVRWIRRATSKDFAQWTPLQDIDCGDTPFEHLYTSAITTYDRAPGTYLMFPSRYVPHRHPDNEIARAAKPGVNDIVFMSSRDGLNFDRSFMEAFIRPGQEIENWRERGIYVGSGIIQSSPTEMSLYSRQHRYLPSIHIRRYSLRTDGFVSMNAGFTGGEFTTRPFVFSGSELELNYSTSAVGSVQVEIQNGEGRPMPGWALADAPETFGDEIDGVYHFHGDGDLGRLEGTTVRLRFVLKDADLYAFRFRDV
jgi:hypothetical protein